MTEFDDFFDSAIASAGQSTPLEIAEYWASRRGKGAPTADDVEREQVWERIVLAAERGEPLMGDIRGRAGNGWAVAIESIAGCLPDDWVAAAGVPVAVGRMELLVLRCDRVTEELIVRLRLPGE